MRRTTSDAKNPKMKQDFTWFRRFCKKSGHAINFYWSLKKKELNDEKPPPQPNRPNLRNNRNDQNFQITTDGIPKIALTLKGVVVRVHTLQTGIVAEITVILELFALKQYPIR